MIVPKRLTLPCATNLTLYTLKRNWITSPSATT
jgi:hypothetical protein